MKKAVLAFLIVFGLVWAPATALGQPETVEDAIGGVAVPDAGPVEEPAGAEAPTMPDPEDLDVFGTVASIVSNARDGNWRLVASGVLALLMFALVKVRDKVSWFKGDRGGSVLVMLLALGGSFTTALASSAPIDLQLILAAVGVAWTAVGGYTWFKKLLWPNDADPDQGE